MHIECGHRVMLIRDVKNIVLHALNIYSRHKQRLGIHVARYGKRL